jgi:cation diffusion facilitator family transporter
VNDCCANKEGELARMAGNAKQRRVLQIVLGLNAVMFCVEFSAGAVAGSASLMADSVDMLGDALVYAMSLYALERSVRWKAGAAFAKGGFILVFGIGVMIEVALKIANGVPPSSAIMLGFGALALAVNAVCLTLLWQFRKHDVNMASTWECSRNDVISNLGVLAAAGGVALWHSPWPDILVGSAIALLFLRSAFRILAASRQALQRPAPALSEP